MNDIAIAIWSYIQVAGLALLAVLVTALVIVVVMALWRTARKGGRNV